MSTHFAHLRFPVPTLRACVVALVAIACIAGMTALFALPTDPPIMPTTRDEGRAASKPTIKALLDDAGADTVILLYDIRRAHTVSPESAAGMASTAKFLQYAQQKGARVLVVSVAAQHVNNKIPDSNRLPVELKQAIDPARLAGHVAIKPYSDALDAQKVLRRLVPGGKTLFERYAGGARNLVVISIGRDTVAHIPTFEAVWSGVNVFRNPLLDIPFGQMDRGESYMGKYVTRMDLAIGYHLADRLSLPGFFATDPFLHYRPIGAIPGVVQDSGTASMGHGALNSDGTPKPHIAGDPGVVGRSSLGAMAYYRQFDVQVFVALDTELAKSTLKEYRANDARSALIHISNAEAEAYAQATDGQPESQFGAVFRALKLGDNPSGFPVPDPTRQLRAYDTGRVEILVEGHGGNADGNAPYTVGSLSPAQLGTVLLEHPDIGLQSASASTRKRVAHLNMRACGVRCRADYFGDGPGLEHNEVEYSQALVRWLAARNVDVERVSVANTTMLFRNGNGHVDHATWFMIRDQEARDVRMIRETALLMTSMTYDRATNTFNEDPDHDATTMIEATQTLSIAPARPTDLDTVLHDAETVDATLPGTGPDPKVVATAWLTASGATIDMDLAGDVRPRLDIVWDPDDEALEIAFARGTVGGPPDVMVSSASQYALGMGMRPQDGPVVVVDTDASRLVGIKRALQHARTAATPGDWLVALANDGMDYGARAMADWFEGMSQATTPHGVMNDPAVLSAYARLRQRVSENAYVFHAADLATREGAAVVNASLGKHPVSAIAMPSDETFLVNGAHLQVRRSKTAYLRQLHESFALLAGPETLFRHGVAGFSGRTIRGEEAVRNYFGIAGGTLPGAGACPLNAAGCDAPAESIDGQAVDNAHLNDLRNQVGAQPVIDELQAGLEDRGPLHRWWTRAKAAFRDAAAWLQAKVMGALIDLGLVAPRATLTPTPAMAESTHTADPLIQRIEGEQLGTRYLAATRTLLHDHAIPVDHWIPVLGTVVPGEGHGDATRQYRLQLMHEGTGETREVVTRDSTFAQTRTFVESVHQDVHAQAAAETGGHVTTLNSAFALMGLMHVLEGERKASGPGLPENLATSLQVQLYVGQAQMGLGVVQDIVQTVQLAREGLNIAREVSVAVGTDASLFARVMGMASRTMGAAAALLGGAMVGLDIYNLAHAQSAEQRAVFGTQLAVDTSFATLMTGAIIAEAAGAATASSVIGAIATPLAGLGIGIVGLVQAFTAVAQDVDASAAKFDKYADLYARWHWTEEEQPLSTTDPKSPRMRSHFTWDAETRVLAPVFGVATNVVDLRQHTQAGQRLSMVAESAVDRANPESVGDPSWAGDWGQWGGSTPQGDRNAPGISINARAGLANTAVLPLAASDKVEMLVLPATPASRFHSFDYINLMSATSRHWEEPGMMGYTVLRRMMSRDWSQGYFLFAWWMNTFEMILRQVQEDWVPVTVDVLLDEHVNTVAMPVFVIPKNTDWTPQQQADYRAANEGMTRNVSYRIDPSARTAPVSIVLQNNFGNVELKAPATGKTSVWLLDARHLRTPDALRMDVVARGSAEAGVVWIDGQRIAINGAGGTRAVAGEGAAEVYVLLPHGAWHVDFAKREFTSLDLLAPSDLVHGAKVHEALVRGGFNFRSDAFVDIVAAPGESHPVNGTQVKRYFQSVRDDDFVLAIDDRYPDAELVFGDAQEGLFHDAKRGLLHRVHRGEVLPSASYQIGFTTTPGNPALDAGIQPHTVRRVQRVDGDTILLMVSYEQRAPDWMTNDEGLAASRVPDGSVWMLVSYRLRNDALDVVGISDHDWLTPYLERNEVAFASDGGINNLFGMVTVGRPVARGAANTLTAIVPGATGWIAVHGRMLVDGTPVTRQQWIHGATAQVMKPLWVAPSDTCRPGEGSIDGQSLFAADPRQGCQLAHPNDAVLLQTWRAPAVVGSDVIVDWARFHSPTLKAVFDVRAGMMQPHANPPRTQLRAVSDVATMAAVGAGVPAGRDQDGLIWRFDGADAAPRLAGFGANWASRIGSSLWHREVHEYAHGHGAGQSELPVEGVLSKDGAPIAAWYLPTARQWVLAPAGAQFIARTDAGHAYVRTDEAVLEVPLIDAMEVARGVVFEANRARAPLVMREVERQDDGKFTNVAPQRDLACNGMKVVRENGNVTCATGAASPKVLEWGWCSGPLPTSLFDAIGMDREYVALTCRTPEASGVPASVARSGWLTPDGERVAVPKETALKDPADYRVLGFNRAVREAYFYHPEHEILYVADWNGNTKRKTWLTDAQIVGESLFLKLPTAGIVPGAIPLLDGVTALGLGTDSERTVTYRIEPATRAHYPRIIIDMGGEPLGVWQRRTLELNYAGASTAKVQRWPGGWRIDDDQTGRTLELRGTGGAKHVVFGDTRKRLDLATLRPVSFLALPHDFTEPAANDALPYSDRHDIDGNGIADLIRVVRKDGRGRLEWHYRQADGQLETIAPMTSERSVPLFDPRWNHDFYTVEGKTQYCGVIGLGAHHSMVQLTCHRVDADGVHPHIQQSSFGLSYTLPAPLFADDLQPWIDDIVGRGAFWTQEATGTRPLVRFNGRTMECLGSASGPACNVTHNEGINEVPFHQQIVPRPDFCTQSTPLTWCQTGLARVSSKQREGAWTTNPDVAGNWVYRINEGEVECASYNGRNCLGSSVAVANLDHARLNPLRCGAPHRIQWGSPGYGQANHWCERLRRSLQPGNTGAPAAPTASNLRITGTFQVGATLRGEYTYADVNGDKEGQSAYQWFISDPQSGAPVAIPGAKARTYTLRPEDLGNRKIWFNIERLRAATGTPRDAANMPIGASVTATVL